MLTTVNISLPKNMYKDVKKMAARQGYSSTSEFVRDALRRMLYRPLTKNGFTREFEEEVLLAASEPAKEDKVWKTEKELKAYFDKLRKTKRSK
ncbi:MAG: ribbon-helix-helix domain-containing protein [Patescibacteria group bacterium]